MTDCLFVYGTLLPGRAPAEIADVVDALVPLGAATVRGRLYDLGEYPGAILDDSAAGIAGQLFALPSDPNALARLDAYEDYRPDDPAQSLFLRVRTLAELPEGRRHPCWIYVYHQPVRGVDAKKP
jgi:gamma-glutamylcyclotransferase (GGCT)/AIG2-like uncharacterized protein YtfP